MVDWRSELYFAKYHLSIAERMLSSFDEYGGKRFLVGVIREAAKASGKIVRTFLIRENMKGNLQKFMEKVAPEYLNNFELCGIVGILNLERDQRRARVEFLKKNEILLEVDGEWRSINIDRLRELVNNISNIVSNLSTDIKR